MAHSHAHLPVVIVGAGVTGLTLAYRLQQLGQATVVLEAAQDPGGNIRTVSHDGFLYDLGPDSFLSAKLDARALCEELGLSSEIITPMPSAGLVSVARDGVLYPMPEGLSLGVPKRPGPLLDTPLLSGLAKLRALLEPFVPRPSRREEETISEFLSRRLGSEMAERLAAPLLSGVFAGDAERLSMNAAFPQLVAMEDKFGSLFSGMNGGRSLLSVLMDEVEVNASPFISLKSGLSSLIMRLVQQLPQGTVRLGCPVRRIFPQRGNAPTKVVLDGEVIFARHVVVCGPPWAARPLLAQSDAELGASLGGVRGFQTATVFFGLDARAVQHDLQGSGFIVPPGESSILASTFVSSKWEHRAPPGAALIRAFIGGARLDISSQGDAELRGIAHRELTRFLGPLGPVTFSLVHRYERGTPQPELGYTELLSKIKQGLERVSGVSLIGSGYSGAGIPDCIRQANEFARSFDAEA